jgi:hypothetical protein
MDDKDRFRSLVCNLVRGDGHMNWEEKWEAIRALDGDAKLCMRKPGDWYVNSDMLIRDESKSYGIGDYGNGTTPQLAVEDHWEKMVAVQPPRYIYGSFRGERAANFRSWPLSGSTPGRR